MDSTPYNQHAKVLGDYNALSTLGFVAGPMIGGHIGETPSGRTLLFMAVALIFMFNAGGCYTYILLHLHLYILVVLRTSSCNFSPYQMYGLTIIDVCQLKCKFSVVDGYCLLSEQKKVPKYQIFL